MKGRSIAVQSSFRGAGLGNEIIPWAKSFIAARELGLELSVPAWNFNRYALPAAFGWGRRDLLRSEFHAHSPRSVEVTEAMYRATGEVDYGRAVKRLDVAHGWSARRSLTLRHRGMWGGYLAVRSATAFLKGQLLASPGVAAHVSRLLARRGRSINVVMHVRLGDFRSDYPGPGEFNRSLPIGWYVSVLDAITDALPADSWVGHVVSDAHADGLAPLLRDRRVHLASSRRVGSAGALDDLTLAASADLLVCSVSSFSMAAAFLSEAPYIWYRPQLSPVAGRLTLWGSEPQQRAEGSPTRVSLESPVEHHGRGVALDGGQGLPSHLVDLLLEGVRMRAAEADLIFYGAIPSEPGQRSRRTRLQLDPD